MSRFYLCLLLLLCCCTRLLAQADAFAGTWQLDNTASSDTRPLIFEMKVAAPEKNILYPAHIRIQCDSFSAEYDLLLVKKSARELGISRNKYAVAEYPFSLKNYMSLLNGIFDLSKDFKGNAVLTLMRIPSMQPAISISDSVQLHAVNATTAARLKTLLQEDAMKLKKVNSIPWQGGNEPLILSPQTSPDYFGLLDTVYLHTRDGTIAFAGGKKKEKDVLSVMLNGHSLYENITVGKKAQNEEILLDTGLNILTLFAENFGDGLPSKGKVNLEFGAKKMALDFTNKVDSAATFIVVKLYCEKGSEKNFQNYVRGNLPDNSLQRNEKLIGSIVAKTQQITLAIWDDAVEDGDSISINIGGRWVVQGFPVKKAPQFITVTLQPGSNTIMFVADNIGSIPPNTSVLEIIDGKKRKSFYLETSLGENNLVKIFYDWKPD